MAMHVLRMALLVAETDRVTAICQLSQGFSVAEVSDEVTRYLVLVGRAGFFVKVVHYAFEVAGWSRRTVVLCDGSV